MFTCKYIYRYIIAVPNKSEEGHEPRKCVTICEAYNDVYIVAYAGHPCTLWASHEERTDWPINTRGPVDACTPTCVS